MAPHTKFLTVPLRLRLVRGANLVKLAEQAAQHFGAGAAARHGEDELLASNRLDRRRLGGRVRSLGPPAQILDEPRPRARLPVALDNRHDLSDPRDICDDGPTKATAGRVKQIGLFAYSAASATLRE